MIIILNIEDMMRIFIPFLLISLIYADCPLNYYPRMTATGTYSLTQELLKQTSTTILLSMLVKLILTKLLMLVSLMVAFRLLSQLLGFRSILMKLLILM